MAMQAERSDSTNKQIKAIICVKQAEQWVKQEVSSLMVTLIT